MTEAIDEVWRAYSESWGEIAGEQRAALLAASVTDDVTFTAPDARGKGKLDLTRILEEFQETHPGAHFETTRLISHNDQALASWSMRGRDGGELLTGNSYAQFDRAGRITHLAGFWQF